VGVPVPQKACGRYWPNVKLVNPNGALEAGRNARKKMIYFTEIARKNSTLCQLFCPAPKRPIPDFTCRKSKDAAPCISELPKITIFSLRK